MLFFTFTVSLALQGKKLCRVRTLGARNLGGHPRILPTTGTDSHTLSDFRDEKVLSACTQSILILNFKKCSSEDMKVGYNRTYLTDNIENK